MYKVRISKQKTKFPKVIPFGDVVVVVISIKMNAKDFQPISKQYMFMLSMSLYIAQTLTPEISIRRVVGLAIMSQLSPPAHNLLASRSVKYTGPNNSTIAS